ncbi:MAG TPA: hypothetical protein VJV74_06640 [Terriglobia bacterium]|nr:hypothetical protein [Terriglobia bacterium]
MRLLRKLVVLIVVIYAVLVGGLFAVMHNPAAFGQVMKRFPEPMFAVIPFRRLWFVARAGHLKVGDPAPDFALTTRDRQSHVELASFRGAKPVVLVFGSYT